MSTIQITNSMLVNHGLSALPELGRLADNGDSIAVTEPVDAVASFKRLIAENGFTVADHDLVATISGFTSPLELATYFINAKYAELGGAAGLLGTTTGAVGPTGAGFVRTFQHGAIYFHAGGGAHEVHGPVRVRWQELGGEKGFLGFPTSDITPGADVRSEGVFAHFQGGSIYWAPLPQRFTVADTNVATTLVTSRAASPAPAAGAALTTAARRAGAADLAVSTMPLVSATTQPASAAASGINVAVRVDAGGITEVGGIGIITRPPVESSAGAFEVHGAIREKYLALGAEASILGYPRTDETGTPDGIGRFNHFQSGSIYWTPATYAHEVHGLIRDRWAALGWERNPQLGYPISDELIPDPRIGHRRPEVRKKPILSLPNDVIKLPAEAASAGFPASVVNTPTIAMTRAIGVAAASSTAAVTTTSASVGALGRLSDTAAAAVTLQPGLTTVAIDPNLVAIGILTSPASTLAETRSVNRFGDFESGVLFWFRGATSASTLAPIGTTSDGTSLSFSGADIATAAIAKIGRATFEGGNAHVASVTFVGTTGYSFDGAQTHNRRHRLQVILQGIENISIGFGGSVPTPVTAAIELQVEAWFDASQRRIALTPTDWSLTQASSGSYAAAVTSVLRAKLDPLLWTSYELITLPDTDGGAAIAVLSVKTLANGAVAVFVEPHHNLVLTGITELANSVVPSVVLLSQPN